MHTLYNWPREEHRHSSINAANPSEKRCRHPSMKTMTFNAGYGDIEGERRMSRAGLEPATLQSHDDDDVFVRRTTSFSSSGHASPESCLLVGHGCLPRLGGRLRVWISGDTDPRHPVFHLKSAAPLLALQTVLRVPAIFPR